MKKLLLVVIVFIKYTLFSNAQSTITTTDPNGRVGIGTTSPTRVLDVNGHSRFRAYNYDYIDQAFFGSDVGGQYFGTFGGTTRTTPTYFGSENNATIFLTNAVERMRINTLGNVGIGTVTPNGNLHVSSGASNSGTTALFSGLTKGVRIGTNTTGGVIEGVDNTGITSYQPLSLNGTYVSFENSTIGEVMRVATNGNVGIGTTMPNEKLHISGGAILAGTSASTSGSLVLAGNYNGGNDYLLTLGSQRSSGGTTLAYGVKPSTVSDSYVSSTSIPAARAAVTMDGTGIRFLTAASQTVAQNSAVTMSDRLMIATSGNVGIGTTNPHDKLSVDGNILAKKVRVSIQAGDWADYVFNSNYHLRSLPSLEAYINKNKHLPEVPLAEEVEKGGLDVGSTQAVLLKKIEELTLYVIEQDKENKKLKQRVDQLENKAK